MIILQQLKKRFPLSDDQWNKYASCFNYLEVDAKVILLKEGEVSNRLFLIEKGCIRAWFNNDGKDVTFQFFFEGDTVASVESFRKKISSPVTLESIEPCILWWIYKKDLDKIIEEILDTPESRNTFINSLFERTFEYMKHFFSFIKDTPQQRYLNLVNERPHVVKRIPQRYIASYLGITTVHLSRIKSRLAKRKDA